MENNWLNRTEMLIGKENVEKLKHSTVIVFGLGGVGSYVVEGLVRAGIGNICIVDKDIVDITNINRQIIANINTVGRPKVDVEEERILEINPNVNVFKFKEFVNSDNIEKIMNFENTMINSGTTNTQLSTEFKNNLPKINLGIDYVVDAIDTISSKLEIIKYCDEHNLKLISCMGTGNKLDATKFEITDIYKTSVCPLAKVIRKELRNLGIKKLKVLYSKEEPISNHGHTPSSISFVPSVAGLLIAGEVIKDIQL